MTDDHESLMGGSPGQGFQGQQQGQQQGQFPPQQQQQQQQQQPYMMRGQQGQPPPGTPVADGYSGYTPHNTPYPTTPQQPSQRPSPMAGSITRFATPPPQQQQQQQQPGGGTPLYPQSSPYSFNPPPQPSTAGMSFAQRSAMLQQHQGGYQQPPQQQQGYGQPPQQQHQQQPGGYGQQQQQQQPPPGGYGQPQNQYQPQQQPGQFQQQQQQQQQQPVPSNNNAATNSHAAGSYAQRYQTLIQGQQQQPPPPQQSNVYQPQQQQQQQQQYQTQPGMGQPQGSMMGAPQQQQQQPQYGAPPQQQQQQQQQPGMPQQQPVPSGSYASRSAVANSYAGGGNNNNSMMQSSTMMPQPTNMMPPQQQQQQAPNPNIYADPPEVIAQQNRLLTEATRKVQEHAYYMKQAMERNDLPNVLDRAASMVGELGEHAHAHHHSHLHPPAPGATGSTTALSPKNYYELHLRAMEELPTFEEYLLNIAQTQAPGPTNQGMTYGYQQTSISYTMLELYDCVQYCPNVLSRLYLQICAASAAIRSGQVGARWVLKDMIEAVKCVQNPVRGLFLRHYLLQAFRDKLPNEPIPMDQIGGPITASGVDSAPPPSPHTQGPVVAADVMNMEIEKGNVKDSYEFILSNFIEMNKLWVRIQHLPGDGNSKAIRRRREKDRNELRILVGTNLVRLSALDSITSSIYGQVILPTVLDHIVICGDPLAQAYLIDCIVQVFPDEYHIETLPILLGVCPKLRDKVNVRTILQSLMDRLANYLADEELLDEKDANQVKRSMAKDSFQMFDECVQNVYNARGPKLQAKEVIRLQTALLSFTMKCYQGNLNQVVLCLYHCVVALQQASANQAWMNDQQQQQHTQPQQQKIQQLDEVSTKELEKLLSIPLDELGLGVLTLEHYSDLIGFLPWENRRQVALTMLEAVNNMGTSPKSVKEIEELFSVIAPVLRNEHDAPPQPTTGNSDPADKTASLMANLGVSPNPQRSFGGAQSFQEDPALYREDAALVSKLVHLLDHSDTDVLYEMLSVARNHLNSGKRQRTQSAYVALVFSALKLAKRILDEETKEEVKEEAPKEEEKQVETEEEGEAQATEANKEGAEEGEKSGDEGEKTSSEDAKPVEEEEEKAGNEEETATPEDVKPAEEEEKLAPEKKSKPEETKDPVEPRAPKAVSCRKVFIFVQQTIASLAKGNPETGVKLYLEAALSADKFGSRNGKQGGGEDAFGSIAYEMISQSFALYEEHTGESKLQSRCIVAMIGTLLACRALSKDDYESLIMKTAQYAAKMLKKSDQCEMVAQCSYLFYVVGEGDVVVYSNPQRGLECLQRALKLADACTSANPSHLDLFVDLLDHYLFFFENNNPSITGNYITGLVALIKEHTDNLGQFGGVDSSARAHFYQTVRHIKKMKEKEETKERFAAIDLSSVNF